MGDRRGAPGGSRAALAIALEIPALLAALYGGGLSQVGWLFALWAVLSVRLGGRRPLRAPALVLLHGGLWVAGALFYLYVYTGPKPNFGQVASLAALLFGAPLLLWRLSTLWRWGALTYGLIALMGQARSVPPLVYGAAIFVFLVASLLANLLTEPAWRGLLRRPRGRLGPLVFALALVALVLVGLARFLPSTEPALAAAVRNQLAKRGKGRSGFSQGAIRLGALAEIATSDALVMRVFGQTDYLRGQVYVDYGFGQWQGRKTATQSLSRAEGATGPWSLEAAELGPKWAKIEEESAKIGQGSAAVEREDAVAEQGSAAVEQGSAAVEQGSAAVEQGSAEVEQGVTQALPPPAREAVRVEALAGGAAVAFVPLEARWVDDLRGDSQLDGYGVLSVSELEAREGLSYRFWPRSSGPRRMIGPPSARDLFVPARVRVPIAQLAEDWAPEGTPWARAQQINARLQRWARYTLKPGEVPQNRDPILYFLEESRAGHCEYFASAFVLLARSVGLPARLVGGYRVWERNPVGGYTVVRQRDAHAWAEIYDGQRWVTIDPTPPDPLAQTHQRQTGAVGAWFDWLRWRIGQGAQALRQLSFVQWLWLVLGVGLGITLWIALRWRSPPAEPSLAWATHPLVAQLERGLVQRGLVERAPAESLEQYARRVRAAGQPRAAELLDALAALRYGGQGSEAALEAQVAQWAQQPQDAG